MKRYVPSLPLSLTVFVLWLLLVADTGLGQVLLAAILAIALPLMAGMLDPQRARFGRARVIVKLAGVVLLDIVLSNVEVARRILGPQAALRPGFIWVPLDLHNIHGITALASIITLTPGTVSAELSEDQRYLLVHCFHLQDANGAVDTIKSRYETPLKEIFK
jgi:multicomponent K+:H+ antiporter subunit E